MKKAVVFILLMIFSFINTLSALDPPSLISPADGSYTDDRRPTFQWTSVSGATSYIFLYDNDSDFSSPDSAVTPATIYTLQSDEYLYTRYNYWKVKTKSGLIESEYSSVWKLFVGAPGVPPILYDPIDGSTISDLTPRFNWSSIEGAPEYDLQVAHDSVFTSLAIDLTVPLPSEYTPVDALAEGLYYWRIRSRNPIGVSNWSYFDSFELWEIPPVPTLKIPTNGSTVDDSTPLLDWYGVAAATGYDILIDNNSDFSSPEINSSPGSSYYIPSTDMLNGTYYWKVRSRNHSITSSYSATWTLNIEALPSTPILVSPTDSTTVGIPDPVLDWEDVINTDTYYIELDDNPGFTSPVIDTTNSRFYMTSGMEEGRYYWRVRSHNIFGYGSYSEVWCFDYYINLIPIIPPDIDYIQVVGNDIIITIEPVYGASDYYIYRSPDPYGTYTYLGTFSSSTYTDVDVLLSYDRYFYRISTHFWDK